MGVAAQQQAPSKPTIKKVPYEAVISVEGKDNYVAYCAVCHGMDGKGGGPAVPALKVPVPDLTMMAKRNGKFDELAVQRIISGADKMPAAHGSPDMPIWGPIFKSSGAEQEALLRVQNLAKYLSSIQAN